MLPGGQARTAPPSCVTRGVLSTESVRRGPVSAGQAGVGPTVPWMTVPGPALVTGPVTGRERAGPAPVTQAGPDQIAPYNWRPAAVTGWTMTKVRRITLTL